MMKNVTFKILDDGIQGVLDINCQKVSLDDFLDFQLQNVEFRRSITHLLFEYFRHKKSIDSFFELNCKKIPEPPVFALLSVAITHALFQTKIAPQASINASVEYAKLNFDSFISKFTNAILRKALNNNELRTVSLPDFVQKRWLNNFGGEVVKNLTEIFAKGGKLSFRTNYQKALTSEQIEELDCQKIDIENSCFNWYIANSPAKIIESELLKKGEIYIQDPATAMMIGLIKDIKFHSLLDVCGAPGGKSLMAFQLSNEPLEITIADKSTKRQKITAENFEKCNIKANIITANASKKVWEKQYDLVIADAPCSNSGVFRQRPDALWRLNQEEIEKVTKLQRNILNNSAKAVKKGGYLLYGTCSLEREENKLQIQNFLKENRDFECIKEKLSMPTINSDGSYGALLMKKNNPMKKTLAK